MCLETGSLRRIRPSSTSIIAATDVNGLVIEYRRKIASVVIGAFACGSRWPKASKYATLPRRATSATAPGYRPFAISPLTTSVTRASFWDDSPTSSGLTVGRPWAQPCAAKETRTSSVRSATGFFMLDLQWSRVTRRAKTISAPGYETDTAPAPSACQGARAGRAIRGRVIVMALKATICKAVLNVSDVDRHYYAEHALTIARHPSETDERMMVRILAFALHADERLTFGSGLSDADEPDLWQRDLAGAITHWIEVGQPDEKRLLRACGRAARVTAYAYRSGAELWWTPIANALERAEHLSVWRIPTAASRGSASSRRAACSCNARFRTGRCGSATR